MRQRTRTPPVPIGVFLSLLIAVVLAFVAYQSWQLRLPPLKRWYLPVYAKQTVFPSFGHDRARVYRALWIGRGLAIPETLAHAPRGTVEVRSLQALPGSFERWLRHWIYQDQSFYELLERPFIVWACSAFVLLLCGGFVDTKRREAFFAGRKLRGPDLLTRFAFNRRVKGDGLQLTLDNRRNVFEILQGEKGRAVRLERRHESKGIQVTGDPGAGKTTALSQFLDQAEANGETAIVYDPHLQFITRYYNPERGDWIANPLDQRCFSWSPTQDLDLTNKATAEATALAQAESLYPGKPSDRDWFFTNTARLIYKHLLVAHQPKTAHELGCWMQQADKEIDWRVKGTELEQMLAVNAQEQRAGIISTLTQVGFALRQVPPEAPGRRSWTVRSWCDHRKGWIFFTNTQDTRTALRPLQSLWIDMLILRILSQGARPDLPLVRLVLDELATLQMLPQLQAAITESRKTGMTTMLGFHGRSQIRTLYGESSETIFSAPLTKILLRTSEPEAGDWMSRTIGEVEREYPRENKPAHTFTQHRHHSYTTEVKTERLVLASEFKGLADRHGYLVYGNNIVPMTLSIVPDRPQTNPAYLPVVGEPVPPPPSKEELTGSVNPASEPKSVERPPEKERRRKPKPAPQAFPDTAELPLSLQLNSEEPAN